MLGYVIIIASVVAFVAIGLLWLFRSKRTSFTLPLGVRVTPLPGQMIDEEARDQINQAYREALVFWNRHSPMHGRDIQFAVATATLRFVRRPIKRGDQRAAAVTTGNSTLCYWPTGESTDWLYRVLRHEAGHVAINAMWGPKGTGNAHALMQESGFGL
ncbi:MAG: hypothetical protein GWO21_08500 [Gammaproteobacteria bacterium]|nr:hypothetical protein [Gammaproteobacteria bacterium]